MYIRPVRRVLVRFVWLLAYLVATVGAALFLLIGWHRFLLVLHLYETECDRSDCSALGDFTADHSAFIWYLCMLVAALLMGLVFWSVHRLRHRQERR